MVKSVWVQQQFGRPVIKAFNNLLAHSLEQPGKAAEEAGRIAMAVSGDDENAKRIVFGLVNDAGYDAADVGNLSESWRHQPGTPAYCMKLNAEELRQALTDGVKEDVADIRDIAIAKLMEFTTPLSHGEVIALSHSLFRSSRKRSKRNI